MISIRKQAIISAHFRGYKVVDGKVISPYGRVRKLHVSKEGYYGFTIKYKNKVVVVTVHQLVAYQKYGKSSLKANIQVRHLDGNTKNNIDSNIDIGSPSENMMDIPIIERYAHSKHASLFNTKYDEKLCEDIMIFHKSNGNSYKLTMKYFGISSKRTLHYILNNRIDNNA